MIMLMLFRRTTGQFQSNQTYDVIAGNEGDYEEAGLQHRQKKDTMVC